MAATAGETKRDSSVRCRDELDVFVGERARHVPADRDRPDQLFVKDDRDAQQGAIAGDRLSSERILRIGHDIGDLHRLAGERYPADDRRPVVRVRMVFGVLVAGGGVITLRESTKRSPSAR